MPARYSYSSLPELATGGEVCRDDRCSTCYQPMLYHVDAAAVTDSFCGNARCAAWLKAIPEARS